MGDVIGHYHSHPRNLALPSPDDLEACIRDLKRLKELELIPTDEILEVVVGMDKKKYKRFGQSRLFEYKSGERIEGCIRSQKEGYDFVIYGYWISSEELMSGAFEYANMRQAKIFLHKKTFPSFYEFEAGKSAYPRIYSCKCRRKVANKFSLIRKYCLKCSCACCSNALVPSRKYLVWVFLLFHCFRQVLREYSTKYSA